MHEHNPAPPEHEAASLDLRCHLGHHLATLTWDGSRLRLTPWHDPQHPMGWGRRAADRTEADERDTRLRAVFDLADELHGTYVVHPDWIAPDSPVWSLPNMSLSEYHHEPATWTPDARALDWACMSCFRSGLTGATHPDRDRPWHFGRVGRVWLARLLGALAATNTPTMMATPTTGRLRGCLAVALSAPPDAATERRRKRTARAIDAAPLAGFVPHDEDYAKWTHTHRMTANPSPFSDQRFR